MKLLEIFQKTFVQVKSCCIFAPAYVKKRLDEQINIWALPDFIQIKGITEAKEYNNEQEDISAIKKKKKKQTRFQGAYGYR